MIKLIELIKLKRLKFGGGISLSSGTPIRSSLFTTPVPLYMEVAGLILGVLPLITSVLDARRSLLGSSKDPGGLKNLEIDLRIGSEKFKIWSERWLGQKDQRDSSSKALWGAEGWENMQRLLQRILHFYWRVIIKLQELQEIDTESVYRSRKSWRVNES